MLQLKNNKKEQFLVRSCSFLTLDNFRVCSHKKYASFEINSFIILTVYNKGSVSKNFISSTLKAYLKAVYKFHQFL